MNHDYFTIGPRKDIRDIKIVLYNEKEISNSLVKRFLTCEGYSFRCISYQDESDLGTKIQSFIHEGAESKEVLILKDNRGRFVQKCPGSPGVICCNYWVVNTCFNCLYDCSYCYLNTYLNSFGIVQFSNLEVLYRDLCEFSKKNENRVCRIGTGEYTDSLMMDQITGIASELISITSKNRNIFLELKTKSHNINHLLNIGDKGNTVLAWSLNTQRNIDKHESGTSSLAERLASAKEASKSGYHTAFHFDPIIIYEGWQDDYRKTINDLFNAVPAGNICWISLGGFRYTLAFKEYMKEYGKDREIFVEEFLPGIDGKYRYFKKNRLEIYTHIIQCIRDHSRDVYLYFCMESADIWLSALGKRFSESEDLENDMIKHLTQSYL